MKFSPLSNFYSRCNEARKLGSANRIMVVQNALTEADAKLNTSFELKIYIYIFTDNIKKVPHTQIDRSSLKLSMRTTIIRSNNARPPF